MAKVKVNRGIEAPFVEKLLNMLGINGLDPSMMMNPVAMAASPGANMLANLFKQKEAKPVENSVRSMIDELISIGKQEASPVHPLSRKLDPARPEDALDIFLRR